MCVGLYKAHLLMGVMVKCTLDCLLIALYLHHHCLYRFMIVVHQLYHIRIICKVQVLGVTVDCTLAARSTQASVLILLSP